MRKKNRKILSPLFVFLTKLCSGLAELSISKEAKDTNNIMNESIILLAKINPNKETTTVQIPK